MVLEQTGGPLRKRELEIELPTAGQVLLKVEACGVCRTDLHVYDGDLKNPKLPLVLGHEIVGRVVAKGTGVDLANGQRVGVPWLGQTCGQCFYCRDGQENLCENAIFTGYTKDGGYAEYVLANSSYAFALPENYDSAHAAPLLCAGLIGYRSYRMVRSATKIGLYGFGAAAHILAQVAASLGKEVYAFTRPGDQAGQQFALSLGAVWAGGSDTPSPVLLDAAIIFAPAGGLVVEALKNIRPGGSVICAGIHMSDIPSFPYELLWRERSLRSVANLTRQDGEEFLALAAQTPLRTEVQTFPLAQAEQALLAVRQGQVQGAAVLIPGI